MPDSQTPSAEPSVTYSSGRAASSPPDIRLLHYNDVYHLDASSAEPQGGVARFVTVCKEYKDSERFAGLPDLVTLFSGDAFNPSLESSVTKGTHMVPILNEIGTDCACVGNHDFDFGVAQFTHLTSKCTFPWLLANVLDPALGEDVPLGNAKRTHMLTASNGVKIGLIGLGEREWLETINSLPPNLIYKSASATAKELVPKLREEGADIVICLSHMREPNDNKLADKTDGLMDLILGGHDHYYAHSFIKGTHVLRSGTDFKQLSYIEARKRGDEPGKWDFEIIRRDIMSSIKEDEGTVKLTQELTSKLKQSLSKPIGWTAEPLDARFTTVRLAESNIGNFVCDIMRHHHHADCAIMAGGTIRGDQIYPPGAIKVKDVTNCFPFEDPVVLIRVTGKAIWEALENGVSLYPALEGRFPQVSNIMFEFDPSKDPGARILKVTIGGEPLEEERKYLLATRGYMARGKDGYTSLLIEDEGGSAEELVCEENGILISIMLRQYFMALRTVGKWRNLGAHWDRVVTNCHTPVAERQAWDPELRSPLDGASPNWATWHYERMGILDQPLHDDESESDDDGLLHPPEARAERAKRDEEIDLEMLLMRKYFAKWALAAGVKSCLCDALKEGEFSVDWTRVIAPVLDGRIKKVG